MKIDLIKGISIQIAGELGKYNSLPIETLIKIAQDLQELIKTIAKYDISVDDFLNVENFKLEIIGFDKGSAVPKFAFTQRPEYVIGENCIKHRTEVNEKFERIIEISNSGDYKQLKVLYPEPIKRNPIVENLSSFVNNFKTSPVFISEIDETTREFKPIYKLNQLKPALKKELITNIVETENTDNMKQNEISDAFGKIKVTKKDGKIVKQRILNIYPKKYSLEYAPDVINYEQIKYILKYPLRCSFEKEDDYFVIQSEMLGIIGTGQTEDDAENSFQEEFDFVYNRFNSLPDEFLSKHNLLIKNLINHLVEKIEK